MTSFSSRFKNILMVVFALLPSLFSFSKEIQKKDTVKIGLLIQDKKAIAAKNGAELAIREINETSGKTQFQLIVKSMEGAWGAGGNEAVKLIFDDSVVALIGSHDGRNAHLVEQAATKSGVVFISAWACDPTLSQAFVPWFFNIVPNNNQQAQTLINEIYNINKLKDVIAVSDVDYDSQTARKSFLQKLKTNGLTITSEFQTKDSEDDVEKTVQQIIKSKPEGLVLFTNPVSAKKIVSQINKSNLPVKTFAPLFLLNENDIGVSDLKAFEKVTLISSEHWFNRNSLKFNADYKNTFGAPPGCASAYAYDAVKVMAKAIISAGSERENIQDYMQKNSYTGITGTLSFDEKGNRKGKITLIQIRNGIPVEIE